MTTGKHDIGFSFVIPPNIPSSVDSPLGFIRYKIKAKAGSEKAELLLNIIASPIIPITELSVSDNFYSIRRNFHAKNLNFSYG